MTRLKTCHSSAPSVRAASSRSRGIAESPAAMTTIAKPAQTQMYAIMIAGVIRLGAEPRVALERRGERARSDRDAVRPGRCVELEPAVDLGLGALDGRARLVEELTVTPGSPSSPSSTTPASPPPGLKSLHTTPVMPPWSASGRTACSASSGISEGRIAVRPSSATPPGSTGSRGRSLPRASPRGFGRRPSRRERAG